MKLNRRSFRRARILVLALFVSMIFSLFGVNAQSPGAEPLGDLLTTTTQEVGATHAPHSAPTAQEDTHHAFPKVLLLLLLILLLAKLGGDLFERIAQPAVLGELLFGIVLGNLALFQLGHLDDLVGYIVNDPGASAFIRLVGELGVVLLLFEVGLEATVGEMISVGTSSLLVASIGVVTPMALGYAVGALFLPSEPWTVHLFIAVVLAATSVGITARVLADIGRTQTREAKVILGAAVIDDVLGLIVLAVVQGIVAAAIGGAALSITGVALIVAKALGFFILSIAAGVLLSKKLFRWATYLRGKGVLLAVTLGWCFLISYLGTLAGLAPIVGAFAAGLVLEEATFADWEGGERHLEELMHPITTFLVPVFFVNMGMQVDLHVFADMSVLGFAAVLTLAAIAGKQACALGVLEPGLNRKAIGIGMIPRGEVGLIVASIGASLRTPDGHPLINASAFSATVIMVILTTMVTPPILKWQMSKRSANIQR
jgi:Kef-type K+ transport system membrane component KefB